MWFGSIFTNPVTYYHYHLCQAFIYNTVHHLLVPPHLSKIMLEFILLCIFMNLGEYCSPHTHAHTCTRTHTHACTWTHTNEHIQMYTHIHLLYHHRNLTCKVVRSQSYSNIVCYFCDTNHVNYLFMIFTLWIFTCTHIHTYTHTYTHTHTNIHTHTHTHTHTCICTSAFIHICMQALHACIHIHA